MDRHNKGESSMKEQRPRCEMPGCRKRGCASMEIENGSGVEWWLCVDHFASELRAYGEPDAS